MKSNVYVSPHLDPELNIIAGISADIFVHCVDFAKSRLDEYLDDIILST